MSAFALHACPFGGLPGATRFEPLFKPGRHLTVLVLLPDLVALASEALTLIKTSTRACWFVTILRRLAILASLCSKQDCPWPRFPVV